MNRLFVICVLSLIGASLAQDTTFFDKTVAADRNVVKVQTFSDPIAIPANLDDNGKLTVTTTADTTVIVCLNEKIQVTAGINSCSPLGRLNFTWSNETGGNINTVVVYPRLDRDYYLSFQLAWEREDDLNLTTVQIVIKGKTCDGGATNPGPGCGNSPNIFPIEDGKEYTNKINNGQSHFFWFKSTAQYDASTVSLTRNLTRDKIFLLSRVGAYPQFDNGKIVDGTYDRVGDDGENASSIAVAYPKPDIYWFTVASNDSNEITYTFTFKHGKEASIGDVNATTPPFGVTKDNNTVEYAATKGGIQFTYFTFNLDELKLGIAPQDDSDGAPDVFADINFIPSPDSNIIANTDSDEEAHLISATATAKSKGFFWYTFKADSTGAKPAATQWVVAVNSTNAFVLWDASVGACANNCTERGVCDETTGLCICDDGYERYDCSDKVFPLVWIILIAIGGAILLAIAIGVPVSCYVKNKKKSGYERV